MTSESKWQRVRRLIRGFLRRLNPVRAVRDFARWRRERPHMLAVALADAVHYAELHRLERKWQAAPYKSRERAVARMRYEAAAQDRAWAVMRSMVEFGLTRRPEAVIKADGRIRATMQAMQGEHFKPKVAPQTAKPGRKPYKRGKRKAGRRG